MRSALCSRARERRPAKRQTEDILRRCVPRNAPRSSAAALMKILLAQRLPTFPALCGETKFNLGMLEALARLNHSCRMLTLARQSEGPDVLEQLRIELAAQGIASASSSPNVDVYVQRGVEIHVVPDGYHLWTHLTKQIRLFEPTRCPSCGPDVLRARDGAGRGGAGASRLSGPQPGDAAVRTRMLLARPRKNDGPEACGGMSRRVTTLATISGNRAASRRLSCGFQRMARARFPNLGRPDEGYVTLVNPSQLKGIAILEQLAAARPDVGFAAVPTWATTRADLERLRRLPNMRVLPPAGNIDEILARTRVLLAPSLWGEGFGLIVVEAMVRGIPVLASNVGGLPEAKLGIEFLLPVRPIEHYSKQTDERGLPIPIVPPQDVGPWLDALDWLLSEPQHYNDLSAASRAAALDHVSRVDIDPFEKVLERLAAARTDLVHRQRNTPARRASTGAGKCYEPPASLSAERLELLAALMKEHQ